MASTADGAAASPPKSKSPSPEVAAPVNPGTIIVADDNADVDSTYESLYSDSTSLASSVLKLRSENGRKYHSYKPEKGYILPSDEEESMRLDLQHYVFLLTFDNALHLSPAGRDGKPLKRVLDAGTGTGIWAIEWADEHPESHVIGVDLAANQPTFVPPNVNFHIDDIEEDWTYTEPFDFIYGRMLTGALTDWPKFFRQSFTHLRPGGWLELADISFPVRSDDDTLPADSALLKLGQYSIEAGERLNHSVESAKHYRRQMEEAGFVNITELHFKWPMNSWPKDAKYKEIGAYTYQNFSSGLYGLSVALLNRGLGWSVEEVQVFLAQCRKELADRSIHGYWPIVVVYGQKPE